jgi:ssDNA-binding Zn-finger/Zn-ribbon topoisomerase 1
VSRLRRLLAAHIDLIEPDKEVRFCKRCGSPMIIKIASQGEHKGRRFFTCSRQPHCTYTENYNVVFEEDQQG